MRVVMLVLGLMVAFGSVGLADDGSVGWPVVQQAAEMASLDPLDLVGLIPTYQCAPGIYQIVCGPEELSCGIWSGCPDARGFPGWSTWMSRTCSRRGWCWWQVCTPIYPIWCHEWGVGWGPWEPYEPERPRFISCGCHPELACPPGATCPVQLPGGVND
jgi:hypothetical protein